MSSSSDNYHHLEHRVSVSGLGVVQGAIDSLRGQHIELEETIRDKDRQINKLKQIIKAIQDRLDSACQKSNERVKALKERLSAKEQEYAVLVDTVNRDRQELTLLQEQINDRDEQLRKLKGFASTNQEFSFKNKQLKAKIADQKLETQRLMSELDNQHHRVRESVHTIEKLKEDNHWLKNQLKQVKSSEEQMKNDASNADAIQLKLTVENQRLQRTIDELNQTKEKAIPVLNQLRNDNSDLTDKLKESADRLTANQRIINELNQERENHEKEKLVLNKQCSEQITQVQNLKNQIVLLNQQLNKTKESWEKSQEDIEQAKHCLADDRAAMVRYESDIQKLRHDLLVEKDTVKKEKEMIRLLEETNAKLRSELISKGNLEIVNNELSETVKEKEYTCKQLKKEIDSLNAHIEGTSLKLADKYHQFTQTIKDLKTNNDALSQQNSILASELTAIKNASVDDQKQQAMSLRKIEELKSTNVKILKRLAELTQQNDKLKAMVDRETRDIQQRDDLLSETQKNIEMITKKYDDLNEQFTRSQSKMLSLMDENKELSDRLKITQDERNQLKKRVISLETRQRTLNEELDVANEKLKIRTEKLNEVSTDVSDQSKKMRELQLKCKEYEMRNDQLNSQLSDAKDTSELSRDKLSEIQLSMARILKESEKIRSDNQRLEDSVNELSNTVSVQAKALRDLQNDNDDLQKRLDDSQSQMIRKDMQIEQMNQEIQGLKKEHDREHSELETAQSELEVMKQRVQIQQERHNQDLIQVEQLEGDCETLAINLRKSQMSVEDEMHSIQALKNELQKMASKLQHSSQMIAERDTMLALSKEEYKSLELENSDLREQVRKYQSENLLRDEELQDIQNKIVGITQEVTTDQSLIHPRQHWKSSVAMAGAIAKFNKLKDKSEHQNNDDIIHTTNVNDDFVLINNNHNDNDNHPNHQGLNDDDNDNHPDLMMDDSNMSMEDIIRRSEAERKELKNMIDSVSSILKSSQH